MKKAFTILELVFVIIILGILAAIALPKLSSSKDDAELSKALNNLRVLISDLSIYALKNDSLSTISAMSNVSGVENVDLSQISGTKIVNFAVGSDKECIKIVFVNKNQALFFGLASNDTLKNAIENQSQNLNTLDFTSSSSNKSCVLLSQSEAFKNLANKLYPLLGSLQ